MRYEKAVSKLSEELQLSEKVVDEVFKSFYAFIRETISSLPLKEELTEEEFNKLRTNFNIPAIGKLHCTYDRYRGMKEQRKYIRKLKEKYEDKKD